MSDDPLVAAQRAMYAAVGECLLVWANVESTLYFLFREQSGMDAQRVDVVWGSVVSLDARITMLQRAMFLRHSDGPLHDDIVLLLNECRARYKNRNEIAHALMMMEGPGTISSVFLEPFFLATDGIKYRLSVADVTERTAKFQALANAMTWLSFNMNSRAPPELRRSFAQRLPDLVQALRAEEARRRKEQSERARLLRHAQALAQQGRLTDWKSEGD